MPGWRPGASPTASTSLPWEHEGRWLDGAVDWIDAHVDRQGDVELVRTRPWSAVARVPTADGDLWFKEAAPALAFEPALTAFLADRRPDCLPELVATAGSRMLTKDAGPQLRALLDDGRPVPSWEAIVSGYAELQVELVEHVPELLDLGVPDSRPETLAFAVAGPVPLTLIHEEVHDGNVFVRDGAPVLIDWAEASISHPFAGLTNTLRVLTWRSGWEPGGPEVLRVRDAYLEPWTGFAAIAELRELFAAGYALGALVRATTWQRVLDPLPLAAREDYPHNILAWREIHAGALRNPERLGE